MPSVIAITSSTPGGGGLEDRVGGEPRRHEDHRRVRLRPRRRLAPSCRTRGCPRRPGRPCRASRRRPRWCRSARLLSVWKVPSRPVMPATARRVCSSTRTAIRPALPRRRRRPARRPSRRPRSSSRRRTRWAAPPRCSSWRPSTSLVPSRRTTNGTDGLISLERRDQALGDLVAARDAAEDVEQHRLDGVVGEDQLDRLLDLLGVRAAAGVEEVRRARRRPGRPRRASTSPARRRCRGCRCRRRA